MFSLVEGLVFSALTRGVTCFEGGRRIGGLSGSGLCQLSLVLLKDWIQQCG